MKIEMHRGDTCQVSFTIKNKDDSPIGRIFDEIYFTVKNAAYDKDFLIQKRLSTGEITRDGDVYSLMLLPEDTDNLIFARYVFDVELVAHDPTFKQTAIGELIIREEVTHARNE
ncbi:MAG: hypothetical protein FWG40_01065 [Peptococcaceae bacterium]|nr:hypothetical protein [Peptococcaceae bacterium]